MKSLVAIDFACNNPDNGMFAGRAAMASYGDVEIEAPNFVTGYKFTATATHIRVHRRDFAIYDTREWVGNWCWNRYWLRRPHAKALLLTLRENGWHVSCGPTRFFDWWNGTEYG